MRVNERKPMRKIIIILLALAMLAVTTPQESSWYFAYTLGETGLALHKDMGWVNMSQGSFSTVQNNIYNLVGDTFYTSYSGLVNVSASCRQDKPSHITIQLVLDGYLAPLTVVDTSEAAFSFTAPVKASNMKIQGYNNDAGRYDIVKCALLIERVQ